MPPGDPAPPHDIIGPWIILTSDQANQVRMLSCVGAALAPIAMKDGTLRLHVAVLNDPYHKRHKRFLNTLPTQIRINTGDFADGLTHPDEFRACQYGSTWEPGIPQIVDLPPAM